MNLLKKAILLIVVLLGLDQFFKIWIKTHMMLGEGFSVFGDWFLIYFIENNGMAFGVELAGEWGKITLSLFRIAAVCGIAWYLYKLVKSQAPRGVIFAISLIFAGAMGNIIDSAFYGIIFSESSYRQVAEFMPESGGYSSFLHGKVVDMLYFPLIKANLPTWVPFWGGQDFIFFRPVFNLADSYISIGVFFILLFHRNYFAKKQQDQVS